MTWRELIDDAIVRFEKVAIEDSEATAEFLALGVLSKWSRGELRPILDTAVTLTQETQFARFVQRRLAREPLQYILGEWEFYGLRLAVNRSVLIPRPETELLVEEAIAEANSMSAPIRILDIGTGSGAIAMALASKVSRGSIFATDFSEEALTLARSNAERLGLSIQFEHADAFSNAWLLGFQRSIDLVVSNPPYIGLEEWKVLPAELREFEPRMALTDEADGFRFYKRILEISPKLMSERGRVILELGYGAREQVEIMAKDCGIQTLRILPDFAGIPRVFVGARNRQV